MDEVFIRHPDTGELEPALRTGRYSADTDRHEVLLFEGGVPRRLWIGAGDATAQEREMERLHRHRTLAATEQDARQQLADARAQADELRAARDDDGTGWSNSHSDLDARTNQHAQDSQQAFVAEYERTGNPYTAMDELRLTRMAGESLH